MASLPDEVLLIAQSQWLFSEEELLQTPSILNGLSPQQERENRAKGVNFLLSVGIMLRLPQITMAAASVYLHRFYMRGSMVGNKARNEKEFHHYSIAAASLFLASKVEENCRKMKEIVVACVRVAQRDPVKVIDEQDKEFWRWRDNILALEDVLLEYLCFDLSLDLPYRTLFDLLIRYDEQENKALRAGAWAFVNDSCRTPMCLLWQSRTIAATALFATARSCNVKFLDDAEGRPWWETIGVPIQDIIEACNFMATVYESTPLKGKSIYDKMPDDQNELESQTRLSRPASTLLGVNDGDPSMSRQASVSLSIAGSDVSRKRTRDDDEGEVVGNDYANGDKYQNAAAWDGGTLNKKPKRETNGAGTEKLANHVNGKGVAFGKKIGGTAVDAGPENGDEILDNSQAATEPDQQGSGNASEEGELDG